MEFCVCSMGLWKMCLWIFCIFCKYLQRNSIRYFSSSIVCLFAYNFTWHIELITLCHKIFNNHRHKLIHTILTCKKIHPSKNHYNRLDYIVTLNLSLTTNTTTTILTNQPESITQLPWLLKHLTFTHPKAKKFFKTQS